jgi:hypothetical protein
MQGYCAEPDTIPSRHVYTYSASRGFYNCTDKDLGGKGSPMMPFLKEMSRLYPEKNFCGIRFAGPGRQAFHVLSEGRQRIEIDNVIGQLEGSVTYGGALMMWGYGEGQFEESVSTIDLKIIDLVNYLRDKTHNDSLPIFLGRYEENGDNVTTTAYHKWDKINIAKINNMPKLVWNLFLTPDKPVPAYCYCDSHHYTAEGYGIWSRYAAKEYKRRHLGKVNR